VNLWQRNKPSKKRLGFSKDADVLKSDMGGKGGDYYLYDYEKLKKYIAATGGSAQVQGTQGGIQKQEKR